MNFIGICRIITFDKTALYYILLQMFSKLSRALTFSSNKSSNSDEHSKGQFHERCFSSSKVLKYQEPIVHDLESSQEESVGENENRRKKNLKQKKVWMKWKNGTVYEGEMKENFMHGKGKICYPNGDYYEGQFCMNKFHGFGAYHHNFSQEKDKRFYEGPWVMDKRHGQGRQMFPGGIVYTGQFYQNIKQGFGYIEWPNGSYYEGHFQNDEINGIGKMVFKDGTIQKGFWKNGKLQGWGAQIKKIKLKEGNDHHYSNQTTIFEGIFKEGIKDGEGCLYIEKNSQGIDIEEQIRKDSKKIEGKWTGGSLEGCVLVYESDNIIKSAKAIKDEIFPISDCEYQELASQN